MISSRKRGIPWLKPWKRWSQINKVSFLFQAHIFWEGRKNFTWHYLISKFKKGLDISSWFCGLLRINNFTKIVRTCGNNQNTKKNKPDSWEKMCCTKTIRQFLSWSTENKLYFSKTQPINWKFCVKTFYFSYNCDPNTLFVNFLP